MRNVMRHGLWSMLSLLACASPDRAAPEARAEARAAATEQAHLRVVDARGAAIAGASVVVVDQGYALRAGAIDHALTTDAEGVVALDEVLDVREPIALVWAPGRAAGHLEIAAPAGEHRVALGDPTPLRGRIDGAGHVAYVWLHAADAEAAWPYFVRCDVGDDGRFRADGLGAGRFVVSSVPIGSAPVLAADVEGHVRLLGVEPGIVPPVGYRFVDREIVADGSEHALRVVFGVATIVGRVVDESGSPIAGAAVHALDEDGREAHTLSEADGSFALDVQPAPHVSVRAEHADYGEQWTDHEWDGWRYGGPIPDHEIELVLRRGAVLSGRVLGPDGAPFGDEPMILVPAYIGSGPATREARTDASGHFAFERMVLRQFDLVPTRLENWNPHEAGQYVRVASPSTEAWVRAAGDGHPIEIALERFELVPVTIAVGEDRVQVWTRWGEDLYMGSAPTIAHGVVTITMERGRAHELWVSPFREGEPLEAPFERPADWTGTPNGPLELDVRSR